MLLFVDYLEFRDFPRGLCVAFSDWTTRRDSYVAKLLICGGGVRHMEWGL